jgi:hypothetical protein
MLIVEFAEVEHVRDIISVLYLRREPQDIVQPTVQQMEIVVLILVLPINVKVINGVIILVALQELVVVVNVMELVTVNH